MHPEQHANRSYLFQRNLAERWRGKTATSDAFGAITGDATGTLDKTTGDVVLHFSTLPDRGAELLIDYNQLAPSEGQPSTITGTASFSADGFDLTPGLDPASIRFSLSMTNSIRNDWLASHMGSSQIKTINVSGASDGVLTSSTNTTSYGTFKVASEPTVIGYYDSNTGRVTITGEPSWYANQQSIVTSYQVF